MLKVLIVDDELHSRETLKNLLAIYCAQVEVVGLAEGVDEGIRLIKKHLPDLLFLDVEMHTGTGFDLLEKCIGYNHDVVFTTAYKDYAIKAFKFNAIDYLLKPIDFEELQQAVERVYQRRKLNLSDQRLINLMDQYRNRHVKPTRITLSTLEGIEFIDIKDIIRCKADGSYTVFHLKNGKQLVVSKHLKEYENLLKDHHFYRTHQSNLINLNEVERYIKLDGGQVVMKDGSLVNIAHSKKEEFLMLMKAYHYSS